MQLIVNLRGDGLPVILLLFIVFQSSPKTCDPVHSNIFGSRVSAVDPELLLLFWLLPLSAVASLMNHNPGMFRFGFYLFISFKQ